MTRYIRWIAAIGIASTCLLGRASAQSVPPTPPPPPPLPPGITPVGVSPALTVSLGYSNDASGRHKYSYDYTFPTSVNGAAFKPGEHVTVTVKNVSAQPDSVTADSSGQFQANLSFTWKFCSARGVRAAAPVFTATGDQGSKAELSENAQACPQLEVLGNQSDLSAQPGSTVPFTVQGFGFVPRERVTIAKAGSNPYPASGPIHARADAQGRIHFKLSAYKPSPCATQKVYDMMARGNEGTSILTSLFWYQSEAICSGQGQTVSAPSAVQPGADYSQENHDRLAVGLSASVAHPGGVQRVTIQADYPGKATVSVRYPSGRTAHLSVDMKNAVRSLVRLRVPANSKTGAARLQLAYVPLFGTVHPSLTTSFSVR